MLNIAIIAPGNLPIPAIRGGAIETLVNNLLEVNEIKHQVSFTVYSNLDLKAVEEINKYKYTQFKFIRNSSLYARIYNFVSLALKKVFPRIFSYNSYFLKRVVKDLNKNYYDIILVEGNINFIKKISKNINSKIVLHLHNSWFNENLINGKEIVEACSRILTVSEFVKKGITLKYQNLEKKVTVFPNCVDSRLFNKDLYKNFREEYRRKLGIGTNEKVFLYCGRLDRPKGVKELLIAFSNLNDINTKLVIIGGSWFSENKKTDFILELEEIAQNLPGRVHFTGYIEHDELPKYHSIADIAVVPSNCNEAAGLVAIEALASGLPLISTNDGGIPEYLNDECSIIVSKENLIKNLTNAMAKLLEDNELCYSMATAARIHALKYNVTDYYSKFLSSIYDVYIE